MRKRPLIKQLETDDLSKVFTRAAEFPSISVALIKDLLDNEYYSNLSYGHVKDLEMILGKKIMNIFPVK